MKKEYSKPTAEKVEFDYTESVVACSDKDWACWEREWQKQQQQQQQQQQPASPVSGGAHVSTPNWECKSTDHWGC